MKNGPLAGFEMDSLKVTLKDGSFHPVDSDQLSFELAAQMGYKAAAKAAGAQILEPIMKLEVLTPEETMEFDHYAPAPTNVSEAVIAKAKGNA
jgi:elongation factor G